MSEDDYDGEAIKRIARARVQGDIARMPPPDPKFVRELEAAMAYVKSASSKVEEYLPKRAKEARQGE